MAYFMVVVSFGVVSASAGAARTAPRRGYRLARDSARSSAPSGSDDPGGGTYTNLHSHAIQKRRGSEMPERTVRTFHRGMLIGLLLVAARLVVNAALGYRHTRPLNQDSRSVAHRDCTLG